MNQTDQTQPSASAAALEQAFHDLSDDELGVHLRVEAGMRDHYALSHPKVGAVHAALVLAGLEERNRRKRETTALNDLYDDGEITAWWSPGPSE